MACLRHALSWGPLAMFLHPSGSNPTAVVIQTQHWALNCENLRHEPRTEAVASKLCNAWAHSRRYFSNVPWVKIPRQAKRPHKSLWLRVRPTPPGRGDGLWQGIGPGCPGGGSDPPGDHLLLAYSIPSDRSTYRREIANGWVGGKRNED